MLKLNFPNSKHFGDYAVSLATVYFLGNGYQVLFPYGDRGHYDLVIEKNNIFQRVQSKWASYSATKYKYIQISLRVCGSYKKENNIAKSVSHTYSLSDFDLLWVVTPSSCYLIPFSEVLKPKQQIRGFKLYPRWDKFKVTLPIPLKAENDPQYKRLSPRLTSEDKAIIKRLLKEGKTQQEIANILNVTRSCISVFLHRNQLAYCSMR